METNNSKEIKKELSDIKRLLSEQENKLDLILLSLESIGNNSRRMDEHIGFVENTYSSVRRPLNYIKEKLDIFSGEKTSVQLPDVQDRYKKLLN